MKSNSILNRASQLCRMRGIVIVFTYLLLSSCVGNLNQIVLFEDDFEQLPIGIVSSDKSPLIKHHYIPGSGQVGAWTVSAFGRQEICHSAWEIVESVDRNFLRQNLFTVDQDFKPISSHTHPIIIAGDSVWHDYKIDFQFTPHETIDQCGVVFRYQDSRSYYFYGMQGNMLVLKMVKSATAPYRPYEKILAAVPYTWVKGKIYKGDISLRANQIYTLLNDSLSMVAEDNTYSRGKVGFLSDLPADFHYLKVSTLNREHRKITRYRRQQATAAAIRINENATPVVWKKILTPGFGTGSNLRFGDLNNDGEIEILIGQISHMGQPGMTSEISCLTAVTTEGEVLWQIGTPDPDNNNWSGNAVFQIHDLDGDGTKEVIYIRNSRIIVADGKTGKNVHNLAMPPLDNLIEKSAETNGTMLYFCDLKGKGRDSDLLIVDNCSIYAYDEQLNFLWKQRVKDASYPFAYDIDNDGKDEIALGYSLLDDDGSEIWNKNGEIGDHANTVIIVNTGLPQDSSLKVIYGAGDWGSVILDLDGNVELHHSVGHVQNFSIANFRSDMPGNEMISVNYWGSQGIVNLYDASGSIYYSFESVPQASMCLPVNWRGDGVEYFMLNSNSGDGGLINGYGLRTVVFPDDGHPDMCNAVLDITGDARDEIITWNQNEIWIYTQNDSPRQGRIFRPVRNPLYNYSNYQFTESKPDWTD